jgi:hypothetical protein
LKPKPERKRLRLFGSAAALAILLVASTASAETIAVSCKGEEFGKPYELAFQYEGGDSGTLKVSGSFGEMSLPAAKNYREAANDAGDKVSATVIWGAADIPIVVPDKAAIESCIKGKLPPDQVTDSDIVFMTIPSCAAAAPPTAAPIPVKVYAELGILDPKTIFLTFKRTYLEPTDLPDGKIVLEPLPPPSCVMMD